MPTPWKYQTVIRDIAHRLAAMRVEPKTFKDKTVLDLGCCAGLFCSQAAAWGAKMIHGIDRDRAAIDQAQYHANNLGYSNVEFHQHDLNMGLPGLIEAVGLGKFDIVLCLSIFKYIEPRKLMDVISLYCRDKCYLELNPIRRRFNPQEFEDQLNSYLPSHARCSLHGFSEDRRRRPIFVLDFSSAPATLDRHRFRPSPDRHKIGVGYRQSAERITPQQLWEARCEGKQIVSEDEVFLVPTTELMRYARRKFNRGLPGWHVLPELGRPFDRWEKWSYLRRSLADDGWDPSLPACLSISSKRMRLANGHHRVAIAAQQGISEIPCCVLYH